MSGERGRSVWKNVLKMSHCRGNDCLYFVSIDMEKDISFRNSMDLLFFFSLYLCIVFSPVNHFHCCTVKCMLNGQSGVCTSKSLFYANFSLIITAPNASNSSKLWELFFNRCFFFFSSIFWMSNLSVRIKSLFYLIQSTYSCKFK